MQQERLKFLRLLEVLKNENSDAGILHRSFLLKFLFQAILTLTYMKNKKGYVSTYKLIPHSL